MFRVLAPLMIWVPVAIAGGSELIFEDNFEFSPDDRYTTVGNTQLLVGAPVVTTPHVFVAGSVLDNDTPLFQGGSLTVQSADTVSNAGGAVSMASDGTFSYQPPAGFEGVDTFSYSATDGITVGGATVTITLVERVWYIDGDASDGVGTSSQPFSALSDVAEPGGSTDPDGPGDFIYLAAAANAYSGGIELELMQHLIGEGTDLIVNELTLAPMGNRPVLGNTAGPGVTLASGVTLQGFDINGTANEGIVGAGVDQQVSITDVFITDTDGAGIRLQQISGQLSVSECAITNPGQSGAVVENSTGTINFFDVDFSNTALHGYEVANASDMTIDGGLIGATVADGIHVVDSNILITSMRIGEQGATGDDGIEIINTSGAHTASIIFNNVFGLGVPDPKNRGLAISVTGGSLIADSNANFFATENESVMTTDSGEAGSLILDLSGNSTLTTFNNGVFTMDFIGNGTHSTIVREWEFPNQVIGGITESSGIAFRQVTFDSDGDPSNGFQQVVFDDGDLDIGQVPPFTIQRVKGDGLRFDQPSGSLRIGTLNIANDGGFGLFVDPASAGTFQLEIGERTIDTINGTASNFP